MENKPKIYNTIHGGPWDRGNADAYYGRKRDPHKYPLGTYNGDRITLTDPDEIEAYNAGYDSCDDKKDYGSNLVSFNIKIKEWS